MATPFAHLTWPASTGGSEPVVNYKLYRGEDGGPITFRVDVGNVLEYLDAMTQGVEYAYQIQAEDALGELSERSNIVVLDTPPRPPELSGEMVSGGFGSPSLVFIAGTAESGGRGLGVSFGTPYIGTLVSGEVPGLGFQTYVIGKGIETQGGSGPFFAFSVFGALPSDFYTRLVIPEASIDYLFADAFFDNGEGDGPSTVWYWNFGAEITDGVTYTVYIDPVEGLSAHLEWTASTGTIASYLIYRRVDTGSFSLLTTTDGATLTYIDTDVTQGHLYSYYVVAQNAQGVNSDPSNTISLGVAPPTPPVAEVYAQLDEDGRQLSVSWLASEPGDWPLAMYLIYRSVEGAEFEHIADVPWNELVWVEEGPLPGINYSYYVIGVDEIGTQSAPSNIASYIIPGAPVLTGESIEATNQITWTASTGGTSPVIAYDIYRGIDGAFPEPLTSVGPSVLTYVDSDPGAVTQYRVVARDVINGTSSNTITIPDGNLFLTDHSILSVGDAGTGSQQPSARLSFVPPAGPNMMYLGFLSAFSTCSVLIDSVPVSAAAPFLTPWVEGFSPDLFEIMLTPLTEPPISILGDASTWVPAGLAEWGFDTVLADSTTDHSVDVRIDIRFVGQIEPVISAVFSVRLCGPNAAGLPLVAPLLQASPDGDPETAFMTLYWSAAVGGTQPVTSYAIYRSINSAPFTLLTTVGPGTFTYSDAGTVNDGSSYNYYVVATDSAAQTATSNTDGYNPA